MYFGLLHVALRIPRVDGIALRLYIAAITYRTVHDVSSTDGGHAAEDRAWVRRFLEMYRGLAKYQGSTGRKDAMFFMYEPRFRYIRRELAAKGLETLILGRGVFDYLFEKHLKGYIDKNKRNYGEYALHVYEQYQEERRRYLTDCTRIARLIRKHFSPSTIVLPKYNDDYTLELIQAFHDAGWRTIVYDREGTVTKRRLELIPAVVSRQAPACDYIVTYNDSHRAFFEKVFTLSSTSKPEILVFGNPASDEWFLNDKLRALVAAPRPAAGKTIVFFAFGEFSYVYDAEYLRDKEEVWRTLLTDIHQVLIDHLRDHPDDELLYKRGAKGNRDYWPGSERLLVLRNARLVPSTANANELIAGADVVVAFQTTALIDAMHTEKAIIYCAWGDNYRALREGLIDFEDYAREGAIAYARSPEEFRRFLSLDAKDLTTNVLTRRAIRERFTTNPDGMVSRRFGEWVAGRLRASSPEPAGD